MNAGKEQIAIDRLKCFEPETEPYWLCYSGGKDSDCIRILAELSGVKYEIHHNVTSVDAPETMAYVKTIPNVIFDRRVDDSGKPVTMWNLIPKQLSPPTRLARYCCKYLKEWGALGM